MTLRELIERAVDIANANRETSAAMVGSEAAAEPMLRAVFYYVSRRKAADKDHRPVTYHSHTIVMTNGEGTLPATVLSEFLKFGTVIHPTDPTMACKMRYVSWAEFVRPLDSTLGYFTIFQSGADTKFRITLPGAAYAPGAGYSGNIELRTPSTVPIPAAPGDAIVAHDSLLDDLVLGLAAALQGDWKAVIQGEVKAA